MKTKYKILIIICFWVVGLRVIAQSPKGIITGNVIDSVSNEKIFYATITLINSTNNTIILNTFSEINGSFSFKNIDVGEYIISTRILGYAVNTSKPISIDENHLSDSVLIHLQQKEVALEEVSVTAMALKHFVEMVDGKMIVNVAKNPLSTGDNAFDILLRSPGISEQNGSLSFRGKTVNVLIEGKLLHLDEGELKNMLNSMPANSIENIEIIANPPAKYDSNGGSLINIILRKSKRNGLNGNVLSGIGSGVYMKWVEGINLYYRSKKLNVFGGYDFESSKQFVNSERTITFNQNLLLQNDHETRDKNNNSYKFGFDYDINDAHKIGITYRGFLNKNDIVGNNNANTFINLLKIDSSSVDKVANNVSKNDNIGMYYNFKIDSTGKQLSLGADYTEYSKKRTDNLFSNRTYNDSKAPYLNSYSMIGTSSFSMSLDYVHPTTIGKFEVGLKFQKNESDNRNSWEKYNGTQWILDTTKSNHFIYHEKINAAYLSYSKVFSTKYSLRLGLRTEQTIADGLLEETNERIVRDYVNVFPNVSFQYTKNANNVFSLEYRRSIDRFGFNILNPFVSYIGQNLYSQGNSNIQSQINNNVEFTYTLKNNYAFGISYTRTENAVAAIYLQRNGATISTFENQKYADLFYVYISGSHSIIPEWTINADMGTGFLEYETNNNLTGIYNSKWSYRFELNNSIQLNNNWSIQLNGVFFGPYSTGFYKVDQNLTTTFGIAKSIMNNRGSLNLAVKDIFNTDKQTTYFENNNLYTNQSVKKESRFLTMTFSYRFGNKKAKTSKNKLKNEVENRINE